MAKGVRYDSELEGAVKELLDSTNKKYMDDSDRNTVCNLFQIGTGERTILHDIVQTSGLARRRPIYRAPRGKQYVNQKSQGLSKSSELFRGRRILFWWVMKEDERESQCNEKNREPLYKLEDDAGSTILRSALQRLERSAYPFADFLLDFLAFFSLMFPTQLAVLLNEAEDESQRGGRTSCRIHDLLHHMKGKCSPVFAYLDKKTILGTDGSALKNTVLHVASQPNFFGECKEFPAVEAIRKLVNICPESLDERNNDGKSPYLYRMAEKGKQKSTQGPQTSKALGEHTADPVSRFLMEQYMREKDRKKVVQYLYGNFPSAHCAPSPFMYS